MYLLFLAVCFLQQILFSHPIIIYQQKKEMYFLVKFLCYFAPAPSKENT